MHITELIGLEVVGAAFAAALVLSTAASGRREQAVWIVAALFLAALYIAGVGA